MNTQHLQYITEIERTRSISQAAENLFIGQPNLSRILHEMEFSVGFRIFERTSKGVRPTARGAQFLQHAKSILRETEAIDALGPRHPVENRLRIAMPRSAALFDVAAQYLTSLPRDQKLDAAIRECHARQALELLANGEVEIGIIRFRTEYHDYFEEQAVTRGLKMHILSKYHYQIVMPKTHPLVGKQRLIREDFLDLPEIVHGDVFRLQGKTEDPTVLHRKIYTVDRMAQLTLLETIPGAYMWAPPVPADVLDRWNLVQLTYSESQRTYYDALISNDQYTLSEIESGFVKAVQTMYAKPLKQ